jgi:hypothetical protein
MPCEAGCVEQAHAKRLQNDDALEGALGGNIP